MSTEIGPAQSNRAIFLAAVRISDEAKRQIFLSAACGGDVRQAGEIGRMLAAQRAGHASPLDRVVEQLVPAETTGQGAATQGADADRSGDFDISSHPVIDHYKLLEQIGEGGMGAVFMAQQNEPIRRRVALKLIKPGMDSRDVISRFQAERQALAMMDHPNIARVLGAGTTAEGRPYFVMELVRGVPITDYCDRQRLSIDDRLRLFIDICRAVQHAHQKGIIHRDLKPSNVMVTLHDGTPVVKVIDFGVAKALNQELSERTLFTQFSQMIGTPLYMSPEQAEMSGLNIDTRSDVYSLGVLLYELLTGTTPFDRKALFIAGFEGMRRMICEEEPPRPSHKISTLKGEALSTVATRRRCDERKLHVSLRGELDWLVMKALEKDRNRRFESASAMASDVVRFLSNEPLEACPPSLAYKLKKTVHRNRAMVITSALVITSLLAGTGASMWQAMQAISERNRAVVAEKRASEEAEISAAVNDFLHNDLLAQADPEHGLDSNVTLRTVLDRAARRISGSFTGKPAVEAAVRHTLARTYSALGDAASAENHAQRALTLRKACLGENDKETIESARLVAALVTNRGDFLVGRQRLENLLERARLELGDESDVTIRTARSLGRALLAEGDFGRAEKVYIHFLAIAKRVLGPEHRDTILLIREVGKTHQKQGRFAEAEKHFRETLEIRRRTLGEAHPDTLSSCMDLGALLNSQGSHDEAEGMLVPTLEVANRSLGEEHPLTLAILFNLASLRDGQGHYDESEKLYLQYNAIASQSLGVEHPNRFAGTANLANLYKLQGRLDEAEKQSVKSLEMARRIFGEDHPSTITVGANLAGVYSAQGQYSKAVDAWRKTYESRLRSLGREHPDTLGDLNGLAVALVGQGRHEEAEKLLTEVLDLRRRVRGEEHPDTIATMNALANLYRDQKRNREAEPLFQKAVEVSRREHGLEYPDTIIYMINLANVLFSDRRLEEAEKLYVQVLEISERFFGNEHPITLTICGNLASTYNDSGQYEKAVKLGFQTLEALRRVLGEEHPTTTKNLFSLGITHRNMGRYEEALRYMCPALESQRQTLGEEHPTTRHSAGVLARTASAWSWELATGHNVSEGDAAKAVELSRQAIELQPNSVNNWNNLGVALYRTGSFQKSIEALEKADSMLSNGDRAHRMFLTMAHWQLGNEETARELYAEGSAWIAAHHSGHEEHQRFRAEAEQLMGLSQADRSDLIAGYYAAADMDNPQTRTDRGKWHQVNGDHEKALEDFTAAVRLQPNSQDGTLWRSRGLVYYKLEQYEEALSNLSKAIELDPNDNWSRKTRGWVHQRLGNLDAALSDLTKCIDLRPSDRRLYIHRAKIYRDLGDFEAALTDCQKAIAIDPESDAPYFRRAEAYALRGDIYADDLQQHAKAEEEYAKAVELDPENSDFEEKRERALQAIAGSDEAATGVDDATQLTTRITPLTSFEVAKNDLNRRVTRLPHQRQDGPYDRRGIVGFWHSWQCEPFPTLKS